MQIVVVADVHGNDGALWQVMLAHPDVSHVFFLGDGVREYETVADMETHRSFHIVSGNCDWAGGYPTVGIETLGGKRIVFMHGHTKHVKQTLEPALALAREMEADLLLFGHTHCQAVKKDGKVLACNPGSLGFNGTYAVLSWENKDDEIRVEKKEV